MNKQQQELAEKILRLKNEKRALLLAHNYQRPEIQEIADYIADSIGLCRKAQQEKDAELLVFSAVNFMAESAVILNPDKKVVIPDKNAFCPMAAMLPTEEIKLARKKYPDAVVMLYVNTRAEAKAMCDVCCTSSNAVQVINSLDEERVIFGPDNNLAWYVQQHTDKEIIPIPKNGFCYVHKLFSAGDILLAREQHPDAEVLVHPECNSEVQRIADFIGSTSQMYTHAIESSKKQFVIATENGLIDRMKREHPEKEYIPAYSGAICNAMKLNTLEKIYLALKNEEPTVTLPKSIMKKARKAVERMTEITGR